MLARLELDRRFHVKSSPSDIVQDTLARAYERGHQFRGDSDAEYRAWLRRIMANVMINMVAHYKSQKRDVGMERSLNDSLGDTSTKLEALIRDPAESPSAAMLHRERLLCLNAALARLPEDQRTAVELRHVHENSVNEIARKMDRSGAAVAGLLRRGLRALRKDLDAPDER
jgi:RNA polymerase sigma-70 factor, ECF subfamily